MIDYFFKSWEKKLDNLLSLNAIIISQENFVYLLMIYARIRYSSNKILKWKGTKTYQEVKLYFIIQQINNNIT